MLIYLQMLESDDDRARFVQLYDAHHKMIERTALQILHNQHDAEDAVQNTLIQVIRHFHKISTIPCEELPFWLISIVKNEALMIRRKQKNVVPFEEWSAVTEQAGAVTSYQELVELFRRLPESYRAVLEMKMILGYTDKEVAHHLNISETAVSTRASRGRKLLKQIAEKEGIEP